MVRAVALLLILVNTSPIHAGQGAGRKQDQNSSSTVHVNTPPVSKGDDWEQAILDQTKESLKYAKALHHRTDELLLSHKNGKALRQLRTLLSGYLGYLENVGSDINEGTRKGDSHNYRVALNAEEVEEFVFGLATGKPSKYKRRSLAGVRAQIREAKAYAMSHEASRVTMREFGSIGKCLSKIVSLRTGLTASQYQQTLGFLHYRTVLTD